MRTSACTPARKGQAAANEALSDAELARDASADHRAFGPLYLRYRDRVVAYCAYRLGDHEEAEDAASAIFLKALRGLASFQDRDGSFRAWLFVIAHHEVANRRKYAARHLAAPLAAAAAVATGPPDDRLFAADAYDGVRAMLRGLPPRERAVLELRAAELDTTEIARVLAITEQNVRTVQCRAVANLRAHFAADVAIRESRHGR